MIGIGWLTLCVIMAIVHVILFRAYLREPKRWGFLAGGMLTAGVFFYSFAALLGVLLR